MNTRVSHYCSLLLSGMIHRHEFCAAGLAVNVKTIAEEGFDWYCVSQGD